MTMLPDVDTQSYRNLYFQFFDPLEKHSNYGEQSQSAVGIGTTFQSHVSHVVSMRAQKQVVWSDAWRIVAPMTYMQLGVVQWCDKELISPAMCVSGPVSYSIRAIPAMDQPSCPQPAAVSASGFLNLFHKAFSRSCTVATLPRAETSTSRLFQLRRPYREVSAAYRTGNQNSVGRVSFSNHDGDMLPGVDR